MNAWLRIFCVLPPILIAHFLFSQSQQLPIVLKGTVTDGKGNQLPFVNIGVIGKNAGTVSDAQGYFSIELSRQFSNDSIQFSSIGYYSRTYSIEELATLDLTKHSIVLTAEFISLDEVTITPRQWKTKILGNTTRSKFMSGGFSSNDLGAEAATLIKIRKHPTYLEKVSFHLSYNKLDSIKLRLNIYAMKDGKSSRNITPENIILNLQNKQTGNVDIDLSKYDLLLEDDVLIALQLVAGKGDFRSSVFMSASVLGTPTYYREASHATWKVYKGLSIGINATVKQ